MGIIYKATSKTSGKSYIGLTTLTLAERQRSHKKVVDSKKKKKYQFQLAILKYGWEDFEWEVLFESDIFEVLLEKEIYYIEKLDTYKNGYNSTIGGEYFVGSHILKGDECSWSVITEGQAKEIVRLLKETDMGRKEISEHLKVSIRIVNNIANGDTWKHLYGEAPRRNKHIKLTGERHPKSKLTDNQVGEIKNYLQKGYVYKELAVKYNVGNSTIGRIARGELWGHVEVVN